MEPGEPQDNSAWKKLWPECVPDRNFDEFENDTGSARHGHISWDDSIIIDDIVTMEQSMGLEVDADYIEELLDDQSIDLTTEEHEHLQNEHKKIG